MKPAHVTISYTIFPPGEGYATFLGHATSRTDAIQLARKVSLGFGPGSEILRIVRKQNRRRVIPVRSMQAWRYMGEDGK